MNTMTFCPHVYDDNEQKMWEDINIFLQILIHNQYQIKLYSDGYTIVIEYDYDPSLGFGNDSLYWVGENEYIEKIISEED